MLVAAWSWGHQLTLKATDEASALEALTNHWSADGSDLEKCSEEGILRRGRRRPVLLSGQRLEGVGHDGSVGAGPRLVPGGRP